MATEEPVSRMAIDVEGIVQGVGFRPFVYRLATALRLNGWVRNTAQGVSIEAEGPWEELETFLRDVRQRAPALAVIGAVRSAAVPVSGGRGFHVLPSGGGEATAEILPDCDVCDDCLQELFDPGNRRFRYPFINCTNCGPRYSIITGIPYDRPLTTMARFALCAACRAEFYDPADRRFHAQPNACPACGPRLALLDGSGRERSGEPLAEAVASLREGKILAVKGIGGYHLAVDACNGAAVAELRRRKKRDEKPFALMSPGLAEVARYALSDEIAERLLQGPERPIVLLRKMRRNPIAAGVAPANGYFGVMLPSSPLQHLLLRDSFTALVMTSGNLSDEPIAYRDEEAREKLAAIADLFLSHDREIHAPSDDSVVRVFRGEPLFLRRSRGYVPRAIRLPAPQSSVLAVGGELKSAVCLTRGDRGFLGQPVGDLHNVATFRAMEAVVEHLRRVLSIEPEAVAHDLHPDYRSSAYAAGLQHLPRVPVQHHHAHMASCMAENALEGEAVGVVFDGTGYGLDGTVWGGEFLIGDYRAVRRPAHFLPVPMPGGDAAVREPFRMAIGWLYRVCGAAVFDLPLPFLAELSKRDREVFSRMIERRINSPLTSSCGRLFDAVAAILDVRRRVTYEGQAAVELEALAEEADTASVYPFTSTGSSTCVEVDFCPTLDAILADLRVGEARSVIARRFHNAIAAATVDTCGKIRTASGVNRVVLSGGVFQNRLLSEGVCAGLREEDFEVFTHRLVPPNDGGLALGQAVIAGRATW